MLYYETVKPNRFLEIRKGDCKVLYRRVGVRKRKSEGLGSNCTGIARMCNAKACRLLLVDFSPSPIGHDLQFLCFARSRKIGYGVT
jgi:hypothetical protein